jgi:hypothetical protein
MTMGIGELERDFPDYRFRVSREVSYYKGPRLVEYAGSATKGKWHAAHAWRVYNDMERVTR